MIIILTAALFLLSVILSYRLKDNSAEELLFIKLAALYLLSVTTITINSTFPFPIGFIIAYILVSTSINNRKAKKASSLLGLISYIICVTLYNLLS
jgi:hypothetical protein